MKNKKIKMLLHLTPKITNKYSNVNIDLKSVEIPELNILLIEGEDITAKKPYPNKRYLVACKKIGKKAINGIYIESEEFLKNFTVITKWAEEEQILTHIVNYTISDQDFTAMTDNHIMFYATCDSLGDWEKRPLIDLEDVAPVHTMPSMDVVMNREPHSRGQEVDIVDTYSNCGMLIKREENITVPTIEIERLTNSLVDDRLPNLDDRFNQNK